MSLSLNYNKGKSRWCLVWFVWFEIHLLFRLFLNNSYQRPQNNWQPRWVFFSFLKKEYFEWVWTIATQAKGVASVQILLWLRLREAPGLENLAWTNSELGSSDEQKTESTDISEQNFRVVLPNYNWRTSLSSICWPISTNNWSQKNLTNSGLFQLCCKVLNSVSALCCRARLVDRIIVTFKTKQNLENKD